MARVSLKAVAVGVVVDFVLSLVLAVLAIFVWGFIVSSRGQPLTARAAGLEGDGPLLWISLVIGFSTLVLGGFVAGRIAKRNYALHGGLVGAISLGIGFVMGTGGNPVWFVLIVVALDVPMGILGAVLARTTRDELVASRESLA